MALQPVIVWFRHELRLEDNSAVHAAVQRGGPIIPVFIWASAEEGDWAPGAASRWWLQQSLASLDTALRQRGSRLVLRQGESLSTLVTLAHETGAGAVLWNRRYEPAAVDRDASIAAALQRQGITATHWHASVLFDPDHVRTRQGTPFRVFSAFWKACLALPAPPAPLPEPAHLPAPAVWPETLSLAHLTLAPQDDRVEGLRATWRPGSQAALAHLTRWLDTALETYADDRHRPGSPGSSRLSPYLHWGEISPRWVWHAVQERAWRGQRGAVSHAGEAYLRQLGWREFAYHCLYHFPQTTTHPWRAAFGTFPWRHDPGALHAWQQGQTGYPFVDAGMRELWATGWMPNRVRMVVASFLVKHLLCPWQAGARWFWDTLVDADLANNTLGWQWTAGCGADAAPYVRLFNPVLQGQKYDPHGPYVRRWVPELAALPDAWVHRPWQASPTVLAAAGVELGHTYPGPMVPHHVARTRALAALATLR
jgi:deoxyribodipyrimidine photo-lyase